MKFKKYIQTEVNQKQVEPSHDAWDRIQARMENNSPEVVVKKSSKKWYAVAAAVVGLAVCTTLFFTQNKTDDTQVVSNKVEINSDSVSPEKTIIKEEQISKENEIQWVEKSSTNSVDEPVNTPIKLADTEKQLEIAAQPTKEIEQTAPKVKDQIPTPSLATGFKSNQHQIATNLDTVKVNPKKKGNYVDPNMLLYSIENKESLKESNNQKSKVAVIDLNKK